MNEGQPNHALEYLLAFDGRIHYLERGYWLKFEIKRVRPTRKRPVGISYSLTLHDPSGKRIVGFDNSHTVSAKGMRFAKRLSSSDHWHRTSKDKGRPYAFADVESLLDDFFNEVERVLRDRGISSVVVEVEEGKGNS